MSVLAAVVVALCGSAAIARAQNSKPISLDDAIAGYASVTHQSSPGIPTDWTSRHVVFSKPEPGSDAAYKVQQDPRYWMQQIRRALPDSTSPSWFTVPSPNKIAKDWSMDMGGTASTSLAGVYPAKFTLTTTTASCTNDFVVFVTGQAPTTTQASIVAFNNLYSGCTGNVPKVAWSYNTSAISALAIISSPVLSINGSQLAFTQGSDLVLLKWSSAAGNGTLAAPVKPTNEASSTAYNTCTTPCMFGFPLLNPSSSSPFDDYGADTLYVGDNGGILYKFNPAFLGVPAEVTTNWPVTADAGDTLTSPVFDQTSGNVYVGDSSGFIDQVKATTGTVVRSAQLGDGTGTAFVRDQPGAGNLLMVGTVQYTLHSSASACGATPDCIVIGPTGTTLTEIAENVEAAINDNSAQCGIPAPCFANISAPNPDATATNPGSATTTVQNTTNAAITFTQNASITLTPNNNIPVGLLDSPVLDSSAETIYTFAGCDAAQTNSGVFQLTIVGGSIASGTTTEEQVGTESLTIPIFDGSFDNKYFTSSPSTSPTGNLYVCGNAGGDPTLYRVSISSNSMTGVSTGPALATGNTTCSPLTEFLSTASSDLIFLSVEDDGNATAACGTGNTGGCVMSFNVFSGTTPTTSASHLAQTGSAGTSGIVIDNDVTSNPAGGSQVYFSPLSNQTCAGNTSVGSGTGPCATQASQSAL